MSLAHWPAKSHRLWKTIYKFGLKRGQPKKIPRFRTQLRMPAHPINFGRQFVDALFPICVRCKPLAQASGFIKEITNAAKYSWNPFLFFAVRSNSLLKDFHGKPIQFENIIAHLLVQCGNRPPRPSFSARPVKRRAQQQNPKPTIRVDCEREQWICSAFKTRHDNRRMFVEGLRISPEIFKQVRGNQRVHERRSAP